MNMISYASLERFEGDYAVCEVEQVSILDSIVGDFSKECYMADVPLSLFKVKGIPTKIGSIYTIEHDGRKVIQIIRLEEAETQRRIDWLQTRKWGRF